nr:hypothetical protein CFP56_11968 [Quercus suber]
MSRLHRVLADSDDDDEDEIYVESVEVSQAFPDAPPMAKLDDTEGWSTGSTERLRNKIHDTELGSFMERGSGNSALPVDVCSIGSPTSLQPKRRCSVVEPYAQSQTREPKFKRVKTCPAWSEADPTTLEANQPQSPSIPTALSTIEPDVPPSAELPGGTIRAAFVDHDPAMFRDTGSTIPDNSTSQRRIIEQAQNEFEMPGAFAIYTTLKTDERSSSFPWPSTRGTEHISDDKFDQPDTVPMVSQRSLDLTKRGLANTDRVYEDEDDSITCIEVSNNNGPHSQNPSRVADPQRRQTSPRVEIPPPCSSVDVDTTLTTPTTQQTTKSRRRGTQNDESDPSCWDELAIGLPKERYVPRPSNRRSKSHVLEVVDFSIAPEKAAKAARAKSLAATSNPRSSSRSNHQGQPPAVVETESQKGQSSANSPRIEDKAARKSHVAEDSTLSTTEVYVKSLPVHNQTGSGLPNHSSLDPSSDQASLTAEEQDHNCAVQKPQLEHTRGIVSEKMRANASSKSKSRRSHTTIFEDHVDFNGCNISPSLMQQQARRKLALRDVHNETPASKRRKPRATIKDDDDDDNGDDDDRDECDAEILKSVKSKVKSDKSKVKVQDRLSPKKSHMQTDEGVSSLNDDEYEKQDEKAFKPVSPAGTSRVQAPEKPAARSKQGRANPEDHAPKMIREPLLEDTQCQADNMDEDDPASGSVIVLEQTHAASAELRGTNSYDSRCVTPSSASKGPTTTDGVITPDQQQVKVSLHSPIKGSSGVPLRVGLSKRSRIQPLLRILKPLKK